MIHIWLTASRLARKGDPQKKKRGPTDKKRRPTDKKRRPTNKKRQPTTCLAPRLFQDLRSRYSWCFLVAPCLSRFSGRGACMSYGSKRTHIVWLKIWRPMNSSNEHVAVGCQRRLALQRRLGLQCCLGLQCRSLRHRLGAP